MSHDRRQARGFTLIELMIAIVVLAVAAVTLLPMMTGYSGRDQAKEGLGSITDFFARARMQAAYTGRAHQVRIDKSNVNTSLRMDRAAGSSCCCLGSGDPFEGVNGGAPNVDLLDIAERSPEIIIHATDPTDLLSGYDRFCFTPDGRVLSRRFLQEFTPSDPAIGAGNAVLQVQQTGVTQAAGKKESDGKAIAGYHYRVIVPYNGLAWWDSR
jgi:prepilin-type N-terminal cleavage/methylation domain-containing protein